MKHFIGFAAISLSIILLSGCRGADVRISGKTEAPQKDVSIHTFSTASQSPVSSATTPETLPPQTLTSPTVTEPEPEPEIFEFPEEFYQRLDEIIKKYELNLNCDGSDECLCNPEYELTDEDGNVIEPREKVLSLYFCDINSGFEYELNPGVHYPVASTVKIPFCTLIYQKITSGEIDPEQLLTYEERHYFAGTGVIVEGEFGQQYTVGQLLELAITRSDNVAYEMLKDLVNWEEFSEYLVSAGCSHPEDTRRSKQKICTESAGVYGRILAGFLRTEGEYVEKFKTDLLNTRIKMIVSDYPVYRKYGWAGFSFHDIAYVDAPRPYILAILTNLTGEDSDDYKIFKEISMLVQEYTQAQISDE